MLFTEREPFVHSGAQSDDSAWNKAGTSFGTKLWQRSHVVGWKSTSSNTRRWLRRVPERNRDLSRIDLRSTNRGQPVCRLSMEPNREDEDVLETAQKWVNSGLAVIARPGKPFHFIA